jgi:hypothetical protein
MWIVVFGAVGFLVQQALGRAHLEGTVCIRPHADQADLPCHAKFLPIFESGPLFNGPGQTFPTSTPERVTQRDRECILTK